MSTRNALDIGVFAHKIFEVADFSGDLLDVPPVTNARSELVALSFNITTDASVDDRRLDIAIKDGVHEFVIAESSVLQPESTVRTYIIGQHGVVTETGSTDKVIYIPLPSIPMIMNVHRYMVRLRNYHTDAWTNIRYCQKYWVFEQ